MCLHFNSQPHKEADVVSLTATTDTSISTHSLTRRLTLLGYRCSCEDGYFNSQPHKEADQLTAILAEYQQNFNSQPHKEADTYILHHLNLFSYFNSQPHKEADTPRNNATLTQRTFQLTASQGG